MITPGSFSDDGDSGSLIVTNDASHNPVGLLFAGSPSYTFANPIGEVLERLSVTIDGPPRTPIEQQPGGGTISIESVTYSAAGGGGKHLYITVALDDGAGSPVAGASVSVSVDPDSDPATDNDATGTATTGADGTVTFVWRKAPSGCYTTAVTAVTPDGWDGNQADSISPADPFPMGVESCPS